jgi:hypothetical protein
MVYQSGVKPPLIGLHRFGWWKLRFRDVLVHAQGVKEKVTHETYVPVLINTSPCPPLFSVFSVLRFANAVQKPNTEDTE